MGRWTTTRTTRRVVTLALAGASILLAGWWLTGVAIAVAMLAPVLGSSLTARPRGPVGPPRGRTTVPLVGVAWMLVAVAALAAPAARAIHAARVPHALRGVSATALHAHIVGAPTTLFDLLLGGALISSFVAARTLRRSDRLGAPVTQEELDRARAVVEQYGVDSLAPFVLRPDKSFEFAGGGVLAYRLVGTTAVVSGDPVGPPGSEREVLARLLERTRRAETRVAVYGASERHLDVYRSLGLHAVRVGVEAVVDPARFTLEGRAVRKLRQSVHRVQRRGWRVSVHEGRDIDHGLESRIDAVEAGWRAERDRLIGFAMSMGDHDPGVRPDDVYLLAWSPEGQLQAVMRFLSHGGKLSLDTMRRVGETPNGLNEALVCALLEFARDRGIPEVSLNYAGLGHLVLGALPGNRLVRALVRVAMNRLRSRFQMDRLVLFNQKFSPQWRPRYLVFESRLTLLPAVARVLQAEGYLPERRARRHEREVELWRGASSATSVGGRLGG